MYDKTTPIQFRMVLNNIPCLYSKSYQNPSTLILFDRPVRIQLRCYQAVDKSSRNGAYQYHDHGRVSISNQGVNGSRTSACQSPTEPEDEASDVVCRTNRQFRSGRQCLTGSGIGIPFSDDPQRKHARCNGRADDTIHVKCLKSEHFLNTEP